MATTTITVLYGGEPLVGAEVCVGGFLERFVTTNENGQIIADLEENFAIVAPVAIRHASTGTVMGSVILIEGGDSINISIGVQSE